MINWKFLKNGPDLIICWTIIIFCFIAVFFGIGKLKKRDEVFLGNIERQTNASEFAKLSQSEMVSLAEESNNLAYGKNLFITNCTSCHMKDGSGNAGPNLTDNFWKINPTTSNLIKIVQEGNEEAGMPGAGESLDSYDVAAIVSYLLDIKGRNLKGKGPEGDKY
ncbi:MAG: c-type cytochrome [Halobacteriovoraceae bacterium]|nr:c-type cytochrome [Halobacteriovoraceae bacterium]